jgi:hypothetical protein
MTSLVGVGRFNGTFDGEEDQEADGEMLVLAGMLVMDLVSGELSILVGDL